MPPLYLFWSPNCFALYLRPPVFLVLLLWLLFLFIMPLSNFVLCTSPRAFLLSRLFHYFRHLEYHSSSRCSNSGFLRLDNTRRVRSVLLRNKFWDWDVIRYAKKLFFFCIFAGKSVKAKVEKEEGKDMQVRNMWRKSRRKENHIQRESYCNTVLLKFRLVTVVYSHRDYTWQPLWYFHSYFNHYSPLPLKFSGNITFSLKLRDICHRFPTKL